MRVEPFSIGSYIHAFKRGARGMPITNDQSDNWRFVRLLYYMNDEFLGENWNRSLSSSPTATTKKTGIFSRLPDWPKQKPLVEIAGYCLMPNHFHLILKEIKKDGMAKFMQKLGQSMSNHFNEKYKQKGSIFQGGYKGRTVEDDNYLRYLAVYVMVKNPFELYPKGSLEGATKDFDDAWNWAVDYPFCSLADYTGKRKNSTILEKGLLGEIFAKPSDFKNFARDCILGRKLNTVTFE